jgi:hypothetical protein
MKIIQSFWSGNQKDINNNYGWYNARFNWISWILSCNQLLKFHKDVELFTDSFGYEILIEKLQLPYTKVHVVLDELNHYHKDLWAVAKIKTFQLQTEPFLHVDGDVFVWESLTDKFQKSELITQNLEITTDYYGSMWNEISPNLSFLPKEMNNYHNKKSNLACNMGIIGGNDINFFKEYTKKSFEFVDKNNSSWSNINSFNFNVFFEQVLFHEMANEKLKKIDFLFDEVSEDNAYVGFGDFHKVPNIKYLHLLGVYKRNASMCKAMEVYTMKYYPESYTKFSKLFNETNNTNYEIEFLSNKRVLDLTNEFNFELRENKLIEENYLLKRDFFNEGLYPIISELIEKKLDFKIVKLAGFEIEEKIINDEPFKLLLVKEINSGFSPIELDSIDEIMLEELSKPISYFEFVKVMETYLEEEDDENSKEEFLGLINNRLIDFVIKKVISIYQ